ncbi:hypothetical protein Sjap_012115 [Stephania japonica]|uniref:Uncharacterized protein n=1 Tax=Stephania japonica TaxID=461633 RepID=A0AAP0NXA7_9MAGN
MQLGILRQRIKNVSKDVVADDVFIFGSVFSSVDAAKSCLNVKLMQNLVNGYVMIIQFGRKPVSGYAN